MYKFIELALVMLDFWRIYKSKRVALRVLCPLVDETAKTFSTNSLPNWLHPHVLGLLSTITILIAKHISGDMRSNAMANVQSGVISKLTGIGNEIIGERIYALSSTHNQIFLAGCNDGVKLFEAIPAQSLRFNSTPLSIAPPTSTYQEPCIFQLWQDITQDHLTDNRTS